MRAAAKLLLAALGAMALAGCSGGEGRDVPAIGPNDMQLGSADAPVEVIEYASASCSHCARFAGEVFPVIKEKYIDTGQIHYAVRELLTNPTDYAQAGFLLARCAGGDKYFPVLEAVFRAQETMFATNDKRTPLHDIALAAGMSEDEFSACISDEKAIKALNDRVLANAKATKGQGTPIFYMNGKEVPGGELSLEMFEKAFNEAKAAAK